MESIILDIARTLKTGQTIDAAGLARIIRAHNKHV